MIREFCLIPKKLVNDLKLNEKKLNTEDKIHIIDKQTSILPYTDPKEYKTDLKDQLRSILKTRFDKGYSLYLWLKDNEKHLEYLKNGDMISPISNINILSFINDSVSKNKAISQDNLNKYKLFVNIVNLPEYFIENLKLKQHLFPNMTTFKNDLSKSKRKPLSISEDITDNNDDESNTNENISPIRLRSKSKRKKAGKINYITTINPLKSIYKKKLSHLNG